MPKSQLAQLAIVAAMLAITTFGNAQTEKRLHSFNNNGSSGYQPTGSLIFDASGNLYGTTAYGGANNCGTVFELSPQAQGYWDAILLYSFQNNGIDGCNPVAGLIFDTLGNLYGTTPAGGLSGLGTVFELSSAGDVWSESVLYSFCGSSCGDGSHPYAALIMDTSGNLYGTTIAGGTHIKSCSAGCGTVFEVSPLEGGGWAETVLHSFYSSEGAGLYGSLVFDSSGNLYGTTEGGGAKCGTVTCGAVFEISPSESGSWTETLLHSFNKSDGAPLAGLVFTGGNLYGTAQSLNDLSDGMVFEFSPAAEGWTYTVVYTFHQHLRGEPDGNLIADSSGDLYGTLTASAPYNQGRVFELSPAGATWTETVLHTFGSRGDDGKDPLAGLVFDSLGNLYGTTTAGGEYNYGTVFEVTP